MTIHNNTSLSIGDIEKLPVVGRCVSKWRCRNITLRASNPGWVVSDGLSFDGSMRVLSSDPVIAWEATLNSFPTTHVYE